ncbi:MAG: M15 family metallopeptidase [Candidatus Omnitrophica bacterium]|nr:M15 family metallopeptidase [Candidatus Omnitrophota bacterium]
MSRLIEDLNDETERLARHFLLEAHDAGLNVAVTSTLRTREIQVAYFAQGRATLEVVNLLRKIAGLKPIAQDANLVITKCDGVNSKSKHQEGDAFDVVLLNKYGDPIWHVATCFVDYKSLGKIGMANGLEWGGSWAPLDPSTGIGWDAFHYERRV